MREYSSKNEAGRPTPRYCDEKLFSNHDVAHKTESCHGNAQVLFVARTTMAKSETGFIVLLPKVVFILSLVD